MAAPIVFGVGALFGWGLSKMFGSKKEKNEQRISIPPPPSLLSQWEIQRMQPTKPVFYDPSGIPVPDELVFKRVSSALNGIEVVRDKKGQYTMKHYKETPEQKSRRERIAQQAQWGMENLLSLGNEFSALRKDLQGSYNEMLSNANILFHDLQEGIQAGDKDTSIGGLRGTLGKISDFYAQRIEHDFEQAKIDAQNSLGQTGTMSSLGRAELANLDWQKRRALQENEIYWMTEGRNKMLDLQNKEMQNRFLPYMQEQALLRNSLQAYGEEQTRQNEMANQMFMSGVEAAGQEAQERRSKWQQQFELKEAEAQKQQWNYMMDADWTMNSINIGQANKRWLADYEAQRALGNNAIRQSYNAPTPITSAFAGFAGSLASGMGNVLGKKIGNTMSSWF